MNMVNISATLDEAIYITEALQAYRDCFTERLAGLQEAGDEATESFKNAITSISTILYKMNRTVEDDTTVLQNQDRRNNFGSSD